MSESNAQAPQVMPFSYQDQQVRVILGQDGEPWWVAKDVCDALEIQNSRDTLAKVLDDDEKGVAKIYTPGGLQEMAVLNESGLYTLIFRSNKPEAKTFRRWVTHEVLPTIRRQGHYSLGQKPAGPADLERDQAWRLIRLAEDALDMAERVMEREALAERRGKGWPRGFCERSISWALMRMQEDDRPGPARLYNELLDRALEGGYRIGKFQHFARWERGVRKAWGK